MVEFLSMTTQKIQLNEAQQEAATHLEGPLLVIAGAGSGKTRVVTCRIAHLLNLGVPASEILAVTFTNKAAEEMLRRVRGETSQNVVTTTFHSLGARILRESIHHLGYQNQFTIYDDDDSRSLVKSCLKILGQKDDKGAVKHLVVEISNAKNALLRPDEVTGDPLLKEVYTLYQKKLREYNAVDFDDLLTLTVELFKDHPLVLERYQKRWRFVLIDEYQDTNKAQYTIARQLVEKHNNLFVVGDPDQSIYSWRGADIHNILSFEEDFPGAKIVRLEQNYRSTEEILLAANGLIEQNAQRYKKELWSELGEGSKPEVHIFENEKAEADFVTERLFSRHTTDTVSLSDIVIFYRTNAQSRIFEDYLMKHQIPYVIVGGLSFYQRREIKDILALLRVAVSGSDFLSFARTLNLPKRGFGKVAIDKLHNLTDAMSMPIVPLCRKILSDPATLKLSAKQRDGLADYINNVSKIEMLRQEKAPLRDILSIAIEDSGYLDYIKEDEETFEDRKQNLEELVSKAAEWDSEHIDGHLDGFLEELALKSSLDEAPRGHEYVKLMTLHNGKGLEFDTVFIVGMEEDLLPHLNSKDDPEALEEERRLCYVGMTRAKKRLYMSAAKYRLMWGQPRMMQASRFIGELPEKHITLKQDDDFSENGTFSVGTYVAHKDFGKGVIENVYQTSLGTTYDIYFSSIDETRSLVEKYARLRKL